MIRKLVGSLILIVLGLMFMQHKGWISITPEGKKALRVTLKNGIHTSKKMVDTLIDISEEELSEEIINEAIPEQVELK